MPYYTAAKALFASKVATLHVSSNYEASVIYVSGEQLWHFGRQRAAWVNNPAEDTTAQVPCNRESGPKFADNLEKILRQFLDLRQSYDN